MRPNNPGVRIGRVSEYHYQERMATIKLDEPLHINDIVEFWVKVGGRVSATITEMFVDGKSAGAGRSKGYLAGYSLFELMIGFSKYMMRD